MAFITYTGVCSMFKMDILYGISGATRRNACALKMYRSVPTLNTDQQFIDAGYCLDRYSLIDSKN